MSYKEKYSYDEDGKVTSAHHQIPDSYVYFDYENHLAKYIKNERERIFLFNFNSGITCQEI